MFLKDMSSTVSYIETMTKFLRARNLVINIEGKIFKVLPPLEYKNRILKLCGLIMTGVLAHIIRRYSYHPITVTGNSIYSRVIAGTLTQAEIPFVLCKGSNRISYYETENGKELAFEGQTTQFFTNELDRQITLIPHQASEIKALEAHTHIKDLTRAQKSVLSRFNCDRGSYSTTLSNILTTNLELKNPVIHIRRFYGGLYYVVTTNEVWLTHTIFSDNVAPLQPGEIISGLYGKQVSAPTLAPAIKYAPDTCIITELNNEITLSRSNLYHVTEDLSIKPVAINPVSINPMIDTTNNDECIIYSLQQARRFTPVQSRFYIIHPFHLPATWDPFLTIMIIVQGMMS